MGSLSTGLARGLALSVLVSVATRGAEISVVPVGADGAHTIVGHDIVLDTAGQRVFVDILVNGWDPDGDGIPKLRSWEADIDSSGYANGGPGAVAPALQSCVNAASCAAAFGGACTLGGNACRTNSDCPFPQFGDTCSGAKCTYPLGVGGFCQPGFIATARADYVFRDVDGGEVASVDTHTPDFRFASATQRSDGAVADPSELRYLATVVLDVPASARGTFVIGLHRQDAEGRPRSQLVDQAISLIEPLVLTPARIIIACSINEDCNDGDECTDDFCLPSRECVNSPNFDQLTSCCDPGLGTICAKMTGLTADGDANGRVDLRDFALLQAGCFGSGAVPFGCEAYDADCDCQVGLDDVPGFIAAMTGPGTP